MQDDADGGGDVDREVSEVTKASKTKVTMTTTGGER